MFDIGWSEILVIAVVAIVVVGPKELPRMLRTFGKTMGQVRRTANDFKRQFDDALREAERQVDLGDAKKEIQAIGKLDPLRNAKKDFDASMKAATRPAVTAKPTPPTFAPPEPAKATADATPAEPIKTGAASEIGSDAA
jgi:sec-independent protein translocase protein TatB